MCNLWKLSPKLSSSSILIFHQMKLKIKERSDGSIPILELHLFWRIDSVSLNWLGGVPSFTFRHNKMMKYHARLFPFFWILDLNFRHDFQHLNLEFTLNLRLRCQKVSLKKLRRVKIFDSKLIDLCNHHSNDQSAVCYSEYMNENESHVMNFNVQKFSSVISHRHLRSYVWQFYC